MSDRIAGIIEIQVNGEVYKGVGNFTYNLGYPKAEQLIGSSGVDGYKETPQPSRIEGEVRTTARLPIKTVVTMRGVTVTLKLNNGKTIMQPDADYCGEGDANSEEGNFEFKFESAKQAEEIT
jgi:hypothetical protein